MNILLEIFGYIGTAFIIVSMTMKSINKLRIFNLVGSIISIIYSLIIVAWPTVVLNVCLATINIFHLINSRRRTTAA
jgi:hypothetical protein